ncbi:MAG: hypothetical protein ACKVHO_13260 [Verrucomicrobiia bacterium]
MAPEDPAPRKILGSIQDLYRIESQARTLGMYAPARRQLRQE